MVSIENEETNEDLELSLDKIFPKEIDFDSFELSEILEERNSKIEEKKVIKKRGRPNKQSLPTEKINNQKLTITVTKDEKFQLLNQAQLTDRSLSNFIKWVLKETKSIKTDILDSKKSHEKEKKVSITISINMRDKSQLETYSRKVNRKVADTVKYILKNTSAIKENIVE